jgi:hypothetical protein
VISKCKWNLEFTETWQEGGTSTQLVMKYDGMTSNSQQICCCRPTIFQKIVYFLLFCFLPARLNIGCLRLLLFRRMKNEEFLWFFVVKQKNEYEVFAVLTFRVLKNEERRTISDSHKRVITKSLEIVLFETRWDTAQGMEMNNLDTSKSLGLENILSIICRC